MHCTVHERDNHCRWDKALNWEIGCGYWRGKFECGDAASRAAYNSFIACQDTINQVIQQKGAYCL